ncbi:MAG: hypothetical protein RLZZ76_634 [Candidatus Parcubacteria bacterium]|jgi:DnaJ-class molecular chaperone
MTDKSGRLIGDVADDHIPCPECGGTKALVQEGKVTECHNCDGDGKVPPPIQFRKEGLR